MKFNELDKLEKSEIVSEIRQVLNVYWDMGGTYGCCNRPICDDRYYLGFNYATRISIAISSLKLTDDRSNILIDNIPITFFHQLVDKGDLK